MVNNLSYNALRLQSAGKDNERLVLNSIASCGIAELCYAYKSRVKSEYRLVEKVNRKLKQKPNYELNSITDVIGLRLITLFRNEIPKILEEILMLIGHEKDLSPNPFQKSHFEEVIIFTNSPSHDPFLAQLKAVLVEKGVKFALTESEEGYSSVHIVTRIVNAARLRGPDDREAEHRLPVEIQIRSVFEDAWGEIDHRFGYMIRSGKGDEKVIHNSSLVQPHLKVLKQFADACAQYADIIYSSANAPVAVKGTGKIVSIPSDDEVLIRFTTLDIPSSFSQLYVEGRALRDEAQKLASESRSASQAAFLKSAAFFLTLSQKAKTEIPAGMALDLYFFYAKMNEALCLLSTDSPAHVQFAVAIYDELKEQYPAYPLVKFRLAQAHSRLEKIDTSISLFMEAHVEVRRVENEVANSGKWPDELPKADFDHIVGLIPKLLGYQYWRKSQIVATNFDNTARLHFLLKACEATKIALESRPDDPNIHNNLAYYSMEYLSIYEGPRDQSTFALENILLSSLERLETHLAMTQNPDISLLDTMMRAYNLLGQTDLAIKTAKKIVDLVKTSTEGEPETTLDILKYALEMQSMQVPPKGTNKV